MSDTISFTSTGAAQYWTAPADGAITVTLNGAGSGKASGGQSILTIPVYAGDVCQINVGGSGSTGGWNGGGDSNYTGGGGGATDIRIGGTALEDRICVAGGAGYSTETTSSYGGGLTGGDGGNATGGTQVSGGSGGTGATAGSLGQGGSGYFGGGGGGGYYGGGGSGGQYGAVVYIAAGGSGYLASTAPAGPTSNGTTTQGAGNQYAGDASLEFVPTPPPVHRWLGVDAWELDEITQDDVDTAANAAQDFAVQRANHTGTQLMSTISDAGGAATKNVGTTAGTVAAGDDERFNVGSDLIPRSIASAIAGYSDWCTYSDRLNATGDALAQLDPTIPSQGLATMAAVAASSTAMAAVIASSTALAAVIASSTAMAAVAASSTARTVVEASTGAIAALAASPLATTVTTADNVISSPQTIDSRSGWVIGASISTSLPSTYGVTIGAAYSTNVYLSGSGFASSTSASAPVNRFVSHLTVLNGQSLNGATSSTYSGATLYVKWIPV